MKQSRDSSYALSFAMRALDGRTRKVESDKPDVIHAMIVGDILKYYGFADDVVSAGYLHDIPEDTNYTVEELAILFGGRVAGLVDTARNPDKSLSWVEKRKQKIRAIENLAIENLAVILADKIANIEDLRITFQKTGIRDFSKFNANESDQRWYYTEISSALLKEVVKYDDLRLWQMWQRLDQNIQVVFHNHRDEYLEDQIFVDDLEAYSVRGKLHAQKEELQILKGLVESPKPFIVEFTGTPRTGKTTIVDILNDFFKKGGFKIKVLEEFTNSKRYREEFVPDTRSISLIERNLLIASEVEANLLSVASNGCDIIIVDRGLFDRLIWMQRLLDRGELSSDEFNSYVRHYGPEIEALINYVVIPYTDPLTSVKRDYHHYYSLEPREHKNEEYIGEYNRALNTCMTLLEGNSLMLDTTEIDQQTTGLKVLENLLPIMRADYIKQLKLYIESKKQ